GIGFMPAALGDVEPEVTPVLPGLAPCCADIWLLVHRELRTSGAHSRRIRHSCQRVRGARFGGRSTDRSSPRKRGSSDCKPSSSKVPGFPLSRERRLAL